MIPFDLYVAPDFTGILLVIFLKRLGTVKEPYWSTHVYIVAYANRPMQHLHAQHM